MSGFEFVLFFIAFCTFLYFWKPWDMARSLNSDDSQDPLTYHKEESPQRTTQNGYITLNPNKRLYSRRSSRNSTSSQSSSKLFPDYVPRPLMTINTASAEQALYRTQRKLSKDYDQWTNRINRDVTRNVSHTVYPAASYQKSNAHTLNSEASSFVQVQSKSNVREEVNVTRRLLNLDPIADKLFRTQARPVLGLDCEMVGIGTEGKKHALARVSIVDKGGKVVYDSFVRPHAPVTDYRTFVSGIEEHHLLNAPPFGKVRAEVLRLVSKAILVGHGLENDLRILRFEHPPHFIRDTAYYEPIRKMVSMTRCPPLKLLVEKLLEEAAFQKGAHDSREDAFAPVRIYLKYRKEWDDDVCSVSWDSNQR